MGGAPPGLGGFPGGPPPFGGRGGMSLCLNILPLVLTFLTIGPPAFPGSFPPPAFGGAPPAGFAPPPGFNPQGAPGFGRGR